MSKPKPKIALAMIVKATDQEAELLSRALNYISLHVDGIFITITGKNKKVEEVCRMYGATVSHFDWIHDFAAARNYNFSQVPKDYTHIIWQDADDIIRGAEKIRGVLKDYPDVDVFFMSYLYWFDEHHNPTIVHLKAQIIKNDGCVEWAGELHEDFKLNREVKNYKITGIERLHLSDEQRVQDNAKRNLEIAQKQAEKHPNDPRVYWNLGNSYKAMGKHQESLKAFDTFLATSHSEDEKYIALIRMAEIYIAERQFAKALETSKLAIGTKPEFPDAYYTRGNAQFEMNDFIAAKESYVMGLKQKPPVHEIIVFNPRDYDFIPLKNLARIYFRMNQPSLALECLKKALEVVPGDVETKNLIDMMEQEAKDMNESLKAVEELSKTKNLDELKKALDELPPHIQSHPIICQIRNRNFIKTSSSGRDLTYFCGPTGEEWDPATAKEKGIGGSEEAVINLAQQFANRGWNVTVYNSCGYKEKKFLGAVPVNGAEKQHGIVTYRPYWMWNPADKQDVTIVWRSPRYIDYPINSGKIYVDVHDAIGAGEFNEQRLGKIDRIMVKSKAHRDLFPQVPDEKFLTLPNGVDLTLFDLEVERDPYYIVNFSSPDRSLSAVLDIYEEAYNRVSPEIKKKMKLGWYYGWGLFDTIRIAPQEQEWANRVKQRFEALKAKGIVTGGSRINHADVARENLKAGVMLYPSEFYEIDWIGGSKAQIAGCYPITTNFAAIGEKVQFGVKIASDKTIENWADIPGCDFALSDAKKKEMFVKALVDYLENCNSKNIEEERDRMKQWARKQFDLQAVADAWHNELRATKLQPANV